LADQDVNWKSRIVFANIRLIGIQISQVCPDAMLDLASRPTPKNRPLPRSPPFWTRRYRPILIEASEAAGATVQAAVDSADVNLARFCAQLGSRAAISQV